MSKEKLTQATAPVFSPEEKLEIKSTRKYMVDMLMMLAAPMIMSWYYYGERAVRLIVISVVTSVLCELVGSKVLKSKAYISDMSAVVTGVMIAMCVPAASSWWFVVAAAMFAEFAAKLPFGSARNAMFVPAAAGIAFMTICSKAQMFGYSVIPQSGEGVVPFASPSFVRGNSLTYMLEERNSIGINVVSYIDIFVGNVPGAMGATCAVVLLGALIYLIFRRPKSAVISLSYLAVCAVYAFIFPRVSTGRLISVVMELTGGLLLFSAVFFIANEVIAPKRFVSRIAYGACAGLIVMLLRTFGTFEDSTVFAVLLINAVAPVFDNKLPYTKKEKAEIRRRQLEQSEKDKQAEAKKDKEAAELRAILEKAQEVIRLEQEQAAKAEAEKAAAEKQSEAPSEPDDDVPTLQDLGNIEIDVTDEESSNGGDGNV